MLSSSMTRLGCVILVCIRVFSLLRCVLSPFHRSWHTQHFPRDYCHLYYYQHNLDVCPLPCHPFGRIDRRKPCRTQCRASELSERRGYHLTTPRKSCPFSLGKKARVHCVGCGSLRAFDTQNKGERLTGGRKPPIVHLVLLKRSLANRSNTRAWWSYGCVQCRERRLAYLEGRERGGLKIVVTCLIGWVDAVVRGKCN